MQTAAEGARAEREDSGPTDLNFSKSEHAVCLLDIQGVALKLAKISLFHFPEGSVQGNND